MSNLESNLKLVLKSYCYDAGMELYSSVGSYLCLPPVYKIILHKDLSKFKADKNDVPAYTDSSKKVYEIHFNENLLLGKFKDYIRLICYHEVAHVYCDELYRENSDIITQDMYVNKGHPRLFFMLMNIFKLDDMELQLQHTRHEIPYNYGTSDGYGINYNPLNDLFIRIFGGKVMSSVNFSRIKNCFDRLSEVNEFTELPNQTYSININRIDKSNKLNMVTLPIKNKMPDDPSINKAKNLFKKNKNPLDKLIPRNDYNNIIKK